MNLQRWKNSKLLYYPKIIRRLFLDSKFRKWVDQYQDGSVIAFRKLGSENPDINIYYMKYDDPTMGFFGYWKFIILGCSFADYYGLTPVVNWTENSPFYEPALFGEHSNPFEYYFQPLSNIDCSSAENSEKVVMARLALDYAKEFEGKISYDFNNQIESYIKVHKKYIRIRQDLEDRLISEIHNLLSEKRTIGVHVRGVEWGNIKGHPIPLGIEEYFDKVDEMISKHQYEQVFIASDSEGTIRLFREKYGDIVVTYDDVIRSKEGSNVLMLFDSSIERENNKYLLGYEVLRDMLTLSYCDGLIAGFSNISLAARVFKEAREESYASFDILKMKIQTSGISSRKAVAKMKTRK